MGSPGRPAILGTLMHELVQETLTALADGTLHAQQREAASASIQRPAPVPRGACPGCDVVLKKLIEDNVPSLECTLPRVFQSRCECAAS